ncbi:MAG: hypothetical protein M3Y64_10340 [Gemmatimonadota bacterium]|nr:hypothetical protein [Gemmatimonadota bacterium]
MTNTIRGALMRASKLCAAVAVLCALPAAGTRTAAQQDIPSPESILGFSVGADFELATYENGVTTTSPAAQSS